MKVKFLFLIVLCMNILSQTFGQKLFHTSVCYDLLSSIDKIGKEDNINKFYTETGLIHDSLFMACASKVHKTVRASNLCNIYSTSQSNKDNIQQCIEFFTNLNTNNVPEEYKGAWLERIISIKDDLVIYLSAMRDAGYTVYWKKNIEPKLLKSIEHYEIDSKLLDSIHLEINIMAGPEPLDNKYPKTYVLDIDNAFNLLDETFCTTYLLLDKEIAKNYRINFIQVYIHENLHRLSISQKVIQRLKELKQSDDFYRANEEKAEQFREGLNEAFVVAAESYISLRLGLKTPSDVHTEFVTYCEGALVLAPIIYVHLTEKGGDETFSSFINRLFDEKKIKSGEIKQQYEHAMKRISMQ